MAVGKTNAIALAGKQTASGTFAGSDTAIQTIAIPFTPKNIAIIERYTTDVSGIGDIVAVVYDFSNNYGVITFRDSPYRLNLGYAGNVAYRPTFSAGVLTVDVSGKSCRFRSSYTYEWFATE